MRRRTAKKHIILPDPKYKDIEVTKFVNSLMIDGKKNIAFNIFYDSIDIVSEKTSFASNSSVFKSLYLAE